MAATRWPATFCPNRESRSGRELHQNKFSAGQPFSIWRTTAGPPPDAFGANSVAISRRGNVSVIRQLNESAAARLFANQALEIFDEESVSRAVPRVHAQAHASEL